MTTQQILNKIAKNPGYKDWKHLLREEEGCDANITAYVEQAMIIFAEHIRNEDRKLITKHVKMTGIAYGNDTSITDYEVDIDSIINTPKQELK